MSQENAKSGEYRYALLMETNGKEFESWYYFIRYEGNEEALRYLEDQLNSVDFYIVGDLSTFDIDLEHLVSERTAKEMTLVEMNAYMFHRKFDGKLDMIDLGFKRNDKNEKKILKAFKKLGVGMIADYIDDEDVTLDSDDSDDEDYSDDSEVSTEYEYDISDSDDDSSSSSEDESPPKRKGKGKEPAHDSKHESKRDRNDRQVKEKIFEMVNKNKRR
jgi:hypothetical protein